MENTLKNARLLMSTPPSKTSYSVGEKFDPTGMELQMIMTDGSKKNITDYTWEPSGELGLENDTITISCDGYSCCQKISVIAEITSQDSMILRKQVNNGENLDPTDAAVKTENFKSIKTKANTDLKITPSRALCETDDKISLTYDDVTVELPIIVKVDTSPDKLRKLEITKQPNKVNYVEGEFFDPTGMEITAVTTSNKKVIVTDYNILSKSRLTPETKIIGIEYNGQIAHVKISVLPCICVNAAPATESVKLVKSVDGTLYLGSGEFCSTFTDVVCNGGALSYAINHIYRNNDADNHCGLGWRLNLYSTLDSRSKDMTFCEYLTNELVNSNAILNDAVDYIYTDGNGVRYSFDETFYWINNSHKTFIDKSEVKVDTDGNLYYGSGVKYKVTRELKTVNGLKLVTQLEGIDGVEKFEQRHEDIVKLESEINQYKDAISELKYNLSVMENANINPIQPSSEACGALELSSVDPAIYNPDGQSLEERIEYVQNNMNNALLKDKTWAKTLYIPQPDNNTNVTEKLNWQIGQDSAKIRREVWGWQKYLNELNAQYNSDDLKTIKETYRKNLMNSYALKLDEYERILEQKEHLLASYKRQAPVAYLVNNEQIMCFNEFGKLCGIVDGYGNVLSVNWGEIYDVVKTTSPIEITSVSLGNVKLKFEYDMYCNLKSITDNKGNSVQYEYNDADILIKVIFSDGRTLDFEYDDNYQLSNVTSRLTAERVELKYSEYKLNGINYMTSVDSITDNIQQPSNFLTVDNILLSYDYGSTKISTNDYSKTYYLDYYGNISASSNIDNSGLIKNMIYSYKSDRGYKSYKVKEVGNPIDITGCYNLPNSQTSVSIATDKLPKDITNFVFSAEARITDDSELTNCNEAVRLPFCEYTDRASINQFCLSVGSPGEIGYYAPFDPRNHKKQYLSLPITIDRNGGNPDIFLSALCDYENVVFDNFRFAPAEWEWSEADENGDIMRMSTSQCQIAPGTYQSTEITYEYDDNHRPIVERITVTTSGKVNETYTAVKKYSYCDHGNIVKTESYIEGEENTKGISITERVCDDKGNVVKEFSYNSLDSSTKFYKESEVSENGVTTAELDETGENKTVPEYVDDTTTVKAQTLPNGSKLAYGYDGQGNVTSITQSTDDGESNSTEINYTLGSPTKLTSGNNTVLYEYDKKRRKTKVTVNGKETTYAYAGSKYDNVESVTTEAQTIGEVVFPSVKADKVTTTYDDVVAETFADKNGNIVSTQINGSVMTACNYNSDGQITASGDGKTGSVKNYLYSTDGLKALNCVDISAGENVESLTESYFYNDFGKQSGREIGGAVEQSYAYFYKDNAARELDHASLPNGMQFYPRTDVNGRNTGKELKNSDNNNVYGEYIYYRKVGDHGTNMPSSIYFGKNKNNRYSITDNIKYKYDESGNISEVRENGILVAKYAYDKIGRLIREDNRKFGKTTLWSYDNCGNILSKRETAFTLKLTDEIETFTDEKLYAYDGDKLLSFGNEEISYGAGVNPDIYCGKQLVWNFGRQLAKFGENTFAYDGYGRRIRKNDTVFTYDANNKLVKQSDGENVLEFVYDNGGLSGVTLNGVVYIYSKDVQGNIVGILDNTGKEVVQYAYDAWGNGEETILDEAHAAIAELNPFRYRSYYYDTGTHLYYLNTRYYDPETGRFISQDDVSYLDPEHINGLNLFAYCGNNPIKYVDYTGRKASVSSSLDIVIFKLLSVNGTVWKTNRTDYIFSANRNVWDMILSVLEFRAVEWSVDLLKITDSGLKLLYAEVNLFEMRSYDNSFSTTNYSDIKIGTVSAKLGLDFGENISFGMEAQATAVTAGYYGKYVDFEVLVLSVGATFSFENGALKIGVSFGIGFSITIRF